ncbi:MAG: hypothetical protein LQ351_000348 [Letrouitia transgressa]|nr:MAG: hypothetical protein LQ351_000348 [Letrouitia transgressa]
MTFRKQQAREKIKNSNPKLKRNFPPAETIRPRLSDDTQKSSQNYQELQQRILNIFKNAFTDKINQELPEVVQAVKKSLYNRNFSEAFGSNRFLEAYTIRWSPCRALAYLDVLLDLDNLYDKLFGVPIKTTKADKFPELSTEASHPECTKHPTENLPIDTNLGDKITCVGGGAGAEIIAFAGLLHHARTHKHTAESVSQQLVPTKLEIHAVDVADWSIVVQRLQSCITTPLELSQYASASAKATNRPLVDRDYFSLSFTQQDVLQLTKDQLSDLFRDVTLVTFMFTLNELYSTSISSTTTLLLSLTSIIPSGSLLLVIDSPSSYASVEINSSRVQAHENNGVCEREQKKYPMQWLLDHTLLESATEVNDKRGDQTSLWEKLIDNESRWFRMPERLTFPIKLEDTRMQVHLYRRR